MAHMNQDKKKIIKAALDRVLKPRGFKYSLRVRNYSSIHCTILSGPIDFAANFKATTGDLFKTITGNDPDFLPINLYWINEHFSGDAAEVLTQAGEALQAAGYYDNSNAQIDYFDTAYYMHLNVGAWDKQYKLTAPTMRQAAALLSEEAIKARIRAQGCSADFVKNRLIVKVLG